MVGRGVTDIQGNHQYFNLIFSFHSGKNMNSEHELSRVLSKAGNIKFLSRLMISCN